MHTVMQGMAHRNLTGSKPQDWACDCRCAVNIVRNASANSPGVHRTARLHNAVVAALLQLMEASSLERCITCPSLQHYRRLMRDGSVKRLERITAEHLRASPCDHGTMFASCAVQQTMAIMRIVTLLTDMGELGRCKGAHRHAEARRALECASLGRDGLRLAHFQVHHAAAPHGRTYQPSRRPNASAAYLGVAVEGLRRDDCDLSLPALAQSLVRYHSMVLAEGAATIALGVGSSCLSLPEWISVASWQQDSKGAPLPCDNLTSFPGRRPVRSAVDTARTAISYRCPPSGRRSLRTFEGASRSRESPPPASRRWRRPPDGPTGSIPPRSTPSCSDTRCVRMPSCSCCSWWGSMRRGLAGASTASGGRRTTGRATRSSRRSKRLVVAGPLRAATCITECSSARSLSHLARCGSRGRTRMWR
mmetsp:Transcript_31410/g.98459  ORF Transcript_31410/g.98459 Transcript_31410/m.98459 type:complete len:420 (+) Transcript_31410:120-1379(+)